MLDSTRATPGRAQPGEAARGASRVAAWAGCGLAPALEAIEGEPQPEHRGVDIAQTLLVETSRLGDVREQLEGAANQLVDTLRPPALGRAAAVRARALLHLHAHDG